MRTLLGPRSTTILTPLRGGGAGGFTTGAAAPAVNMLEEALTLRVRSRLFYALVHVTLRIET